mgnify:CR=1 FL=1
MRVQARDRGLLVPDFVHVLNYDRLRDFIERVPPPWVFKPRSEAGAIGIKKVGSADELWKWLETLGDQQSFFVLERYVPGRVYHVDSIVSEREVVFSIASGYWLPPMDVSHGGGIFTTSVLPRENEDTQALLELNRELLAALGMVRGINHVEFIKGDDGHLYFLECAARVGGANIAEMVDYASGVNLWDEWAHIEVANARGEDYTGPTPKDGFAGILQCLSQQEWPDLSAYNDPEAVWKLHKKNHAGLIVASPSHDRVIELLHQYRARFVQDFLAVLPPRDKPE